MTECIIKSKYFDVNVEITDDILEDLYDYVDEVIDAERFYNESGFMVYYELSKYRGTILRVDYMYEAQLKDEVKSGLKVLFETINNFFLVNYNEVY
jgi:hypothetical protein